MAAATSLEEMVTALVPSLSHSLAEQFNVFRVMHHGTHEKQLSNVFAWLLTPDGTHHLGETFQRLFIAQVNGQLPAGGELPAEDTWSPRKWTRRGRRISVRTSRTFS